MSRQNQGRTFFGTNGVPTAINVTFGNASPTLDLLPLPASAGDIRILTDQANPNDLKWVCTVSGTPGTWVLVSAGGGSGGDILVFESINLVGTKLAAFDTTGKLQGTIAYVGNDTFAGQHSVQDFFILKYGENLSPDGKVVVNSPTFLADGAQWVRMLIHNQANEQRGFWCIDPQNTTGVAHDENSGWGLTQALARLNPLRTIEELDRRMVGVIINSEVIFEQYSSFTGPQNGQLTNIRTKNGDGFPIWSGFKTAIYTGVLTAVSAENPAANTRTMLTAVGLGAAHVGKFIMNAAGTKSAFVQKDMGGGQVGVTLPTLGRATPYTQGQATFTVGETVSVFTLPTLFNWPFPESVLYPAMTWVEWHSGFASDEMAGSHPSIFGVRVNNLTCTGPSGFFDGCLFAASGFLTAPGNLALQNCGILNGFLTVLSGLINIGHNTLDIQNGTLMLSGGAVLTGGTVTTGIGAFDCTGAAPGTGLGALVIQRGVGGRIQLAPTGHIYGSGNTGYLVVAAVGTQSTVPDGANCTATTTAAKPLFVEGVEYDYADIPISTTNLTGLNNVDA